MASLGTLTAIANAILQKDEDIQELQNSIPTKLSSLTNDTNFITKAVSDLTNYYTKSNTYTKTEVDNLLSAIPKFKIEVVSSLPTSSISTSTVYLVTSGTESQNLYDEYIYVNSKWEKLGTQKVDLTNYALKTDIPTSDISANTTARHTHSNKDVLDGIDADDITNWNGKSTFSGNASDLTYDDAHQAVSKTEKDNWVTQEDLIGNIMIDLDAEQPTLEIATKVELNTEIERAKAAEKVNSDNISTISSELSAKVGYAEYTDSYLYLYADSTKATQIAKLLIEGGSSTGGISEAKCKEIVESYGYITSDDLTVYVKSDDLADVATSGSYEDLTNKPTIPDETTVTQVLTSGTEIAKINDTSIFAPSGGGSSSEWTEIANVVTDEEVTSFAYAIPDSCKEVYFFISAPVDSNNTANKTLQIKLDDVVAGGFLNCFSYNAANWFIGELSILSGYFDLELHLSYTNDAWYNTSYTRTISGVRKAYTFDKFGVLTIQGENGTFKFGEGTIFKLYVR